MKLQRIIDKFYKYLYLILFLGSLFLFAAVVIYQRAPARHAVQTQDLVDAWNADYRPKKRIHKKHEQRCRLILETILRAPFPSVRPDFLRYKTGKNLELDGYNESLGLAFEYQGVQHRKYCPGLFHRDHSDFVNQQERDAFKKRTCEALGVRVIYIPDTVPYDSLWDYIETELTRVA
jgi:hypothetical protein